jgi:hypothetical protein
MPPTVCARRTPVRRVRWTAQRIHTDAALRSLLPSRRSATLGAMLCVKPSTDHTMAELTIDTDGKQRVRSCGPLRVPHAVSERKQSHPWVGLRVSSRR